VKSELRRAFFKKSNIILVVAVVCLMLLNTYYETWATALTAEGAWDLEPDYVVYYQKYFGNVYRVWRGSYRMVRQLAPLILVAPYLTTYVSEKVNHFRYYCISRKGKKRYILHKVLAIVLSGTILLGISEILFAGITYAMTEHDTSAEFLQEIVYFKTDYFMNNPLKYFVLIYISHIIYYFCFLIFSVGITSFIKNKIAVIIVPFIFVVILEMTLTTMLMPSVVMQPYYDDFSFAGYLILNLIYVVVGLFSLYICEKIYTRKGS
jgi:hypothetical protein